MTHAEERLRSFYYGRLSVDIQGVLDELDLFRDEVRKWRACAKYDVTMEGAVFAGRWDRSALERCRRYAEQHPLDDDTAKQPVLENDNG